MALKVVVVVAALLLVAALADRKKRQGRCENNVNCVLPECLCPNEGFRGRGETPGNLRPRDIPQIVIFSFDDAVNVQNIDIYNRLFPPTIKNPNGCPISMTLFVSHNFTNYNMVRSLHDRGIEIAAHSVTHRTPVSFWKTITKDAILFEAGYCKRLIAENAGIPEVDIRGWRSPFLETGGDTSFEVLQNLGYEYDASILASGRSGAADQQWPFTMDFGFPGICHIPPCPKAGYPGFWEVPVVPVDDLASKYPCTYLDACFSSPRTKAETWQILMKNFLRNYNGRRAPLYINLHASWFFLAEYRLEALEDFMRDILYSCETYIIGIHQALEWVRRPQNLTQAITFAPWQC